MANAGQQYCLRWNNHRSNLLTVFDQLLQSEAFTDVTLACEGGVSIKCHKMVLAACSAYFAALFAELPCKHPVVVLKDVKYADMKAILEYMYRGEVNVEQQQLTALIRVAETLKVKGLVEENGHHSSGCAPEDYNNKHHNNNTISNPKEELVPTSAPSPPSSITTSTGLGAASPPHSTYNKYPYKSPSSDRERERERARLPLPLWAMPGVPMATSPLQPQSSILAAAYESGDMSPLQRKKLSSLLLHSRDTPILRTVLGQAQGSEGGAAGNGQGSAGSRAGSGSGSAQGQADSSQPVSLVCHPDSHDSRPGSHNHSNGYMYDFEKVKQEGNEGSPSPYTDISMNEEDLEKSRMMIPSSSPLSAADMRGVSSNIVPYVQQQKPEWKRYKQYTRNDIECAIEAVRSGMSALKAARKFGVPSRTLYDKVKKRGIVTNRPIKRASNGGNAAGGSNGNSNGNGEASNGASSNGVAFPFGLSGAPVQGWMAHNMDEPENSGMPATGLVEHWMVKAEMEREAIAAMASAQAAHALSINSGSSSSPPEDRERDRSRDRSPEARSPSPSAKPAPRYPPHLAGALGLGQLGQLGHALSALGAQQAQAAARSESPPAQRERERERDASSPPMDVDAYQDQVEDLSVARTTSSSEEMSPPSSGPGHAATPHASRVIVSMQAARQEEERERERERERDLDRGLEIRGPAPIIAMDETRGSPMEVGGERD